MTLTGTSFSDYCPYGMADDDGYADPGEWITYRATIRNAGFMDATNVVATLTSPYPITITSGVSSLGSLAIGASAQAFFEFQLPLSALCGTLIPLNITVTADQEPNTWALGGNLRVGEYYEGATTTVFFEAFETWAGGAPVGWTIEADGSGMNWFQGSTGYWGNWVGSGDFAEVDTYVANFADGTTNMISPPFALSGAFGTASLQYKTQYYDYYGASNSYLDISADGGTTWSHLQTFHDSFFNGVGGAQNVNISPFIGQSGLLVRFQANSPLYYTIWEVDDFGIYGKYPDICYSTGCVPPFQVKVLTPIDGIDLYGLTEVCAQVTDPALVDHVNWYIDGMPVMGCTGLTTLPYCCLFDPQMYGIGPHTLRVEAVLLDLSSVWSVPVTFYTVGMVMAFPDAFPPSGIVPLSVLFTSNAVWGSGQYVFDWWIPNASGSGGTTVTTTEPTMSYTFTTAGDYLVTLFVTDTMGTADLLDDVMIMLPPIKITAVQLATPVEPNANLSTSLVAAR
jgi:uncharacterized repeat protein (TIGR01451 family)